MNKLIKAMGAITLALAGAGLASATPITATPTFSVSGMTFSFGQNACVLTSSSNPSSPSDCSQIEVNTVNSPNLGTGLVINSGFFASNNHYTDVAITYGLKASSGISQIGLSFVGGILGDAIVRVDETAVSGGKAVGSASVSCASLSNGGGCTKSSGMVLLNGTYTDLTVVKDIYLGASLNSSAATSAIYQTFATPEPVSIALMGGGLMILGIARIRRNRKA
jgi:hypothetical protein